MISAASARRRPAAPAATLAAVAVAACRRWPVRLVSVLLLWMVMTPAPAMTGPASRDARVEADGPHQEQLRLRRQMVEVIRARGVTDARVLAALEQVPRHLFVPDDERAQAYEDRPLPIGSAQTISQPYIVALMSSLLELTPTSRVLEIGTGSGYQAAVLARLAGQVYSIEIVPELAAQARATLAHLGVSNLHLRVGDGYRGWPDAAPFDAIILTAAPPAVPQPLIEQLKPGGRMVLPVGRGRQELTLLTRGAGGAVQRREVLPVLFVPMTGEAEGKP